MSEALQSSCVTRTWQPGLQGFPLLCERYQIIGVLGEGGMGTVFKGFHVNLKRFVAIKTVRADQLAHVHLVKRFRQEIQIAGQMDHPNVVRATDAGERNGVFFLVMEYLEGVGLARLVAEHGPLHVHNACELARQTALGLAYIHRRLVHRDIKPSNLFLAATGLVKVLDLGLARVFEAEAGDRECEQTPVGCPVGTYDYLAPEQAMAGAEVDGRADQYALGCTLFKLLTGQAPFSGSEFASVPRKLFAHCNIPVTEAPGFELIPADLRPVLLRMTAKSPGDRFPTMSDAAEALEPFVAGAEPLRLLELAAKSDQGILQPLAEQLPENLSRLTVLPNDTPPTRAAQAKVLPEASPRRRRMLAIGLPALALLVLSAWWIIASLVHQDPTSEAVANGSTGAAIKTFETDKADRPPLDRLATGVHHLLLEWPPIPIGLDHEDDQRFSWKKGANRLDIIGGDSSWFLLGTTSRPCYLLEVAIRQSPWTGNVGLFWGYREDAGKKEKRTGDFATLQMICLRKETDNRGGDVYAAQRGLVTLSYSPRGDIHAGLHFKARHVLPQLAHHELVLGFEVDHDRLRQAFFAGIPLTGLYDQSANESFASAPYQGGLGLFSISHSAVFSNARFFAFSKR